MTSPTTSQTDSPSRSRHGRRSRAALAIAVTVAAVAGGTVAVWSLFGDDELPPGVSREDYQLAERRFRETYDRDPSRLDVLSLLGEVLVAEERLETALACFRAIPTDYPEYGVAARLQEGQVLILLNRADDAERNYREFLSHAAQDPAVPLAEVVSARKWLGYLLSVELRLEERKELLTKVHAAGLADIYDSKQYHFPTLLLWHSSSGRHRLTEFLEEDPDNPRLRTAYGRYLTTDGKLDEARTLLEELHRERPDDLVCAAALLECLFEGNEREAFAEVANTLPDYADGEPWILTQLRGQFALEEKRWEEAVRYFEHALEDDPANPVCHMGLARAYAGLGRTEERKEALRRSRIISEIRVDLVGVTEEDAEASRELAAACEQAGLAEAAEAFRRHAIRIERGVSGARPPAAAPLQRAESATP